MQGISPASKNLDPPRQEASCTSWLHTWHGSKDGTLLLFQARHVDLQLRRSWLNHSIAACTPQVDTLQVSFPVGLFAS